MTYTEISSASAGREAWLGQSHGYRIAGDWACLNAELALADNEAALAQHWALQLWACDKPYQGGTLEGVKVAEAAVDVQASLLSSQPQQLYAETFARLPAGEGEYAMVLVLASRDGAQEQVHDFANYPAREHFYVPALRGELREERGSELVTVRAERIENPRGSENLSGTLALELWGLSETYQGEQFTGTALAGVELGRLEGGATLHDVELHAPAETLAEHAHLTVMLREWTASGYVTRDYRNLVARAAAVAEQAAPAPLPEAPKPAVVAAPVAEQVAPATAPEAPTPAAVAAPAVSDKPVAARATPSVPAATPAAVTEPAAGLVSVQHSTLDQLAKVPGLNRKLAQEIIKARPFKNLEQLKKVRGIGEATLRKLRAVLTL
jgi:DNA uptake protein ComE-like DNA-binding protein